MRLIIITLVIKLKHLQNLYADYEHTFEPKENVRQSQNHNTKILFLMFIKKTTTKHLTIQMRT